MSYYDFSYIATEALKLFNHVRNPSEADLYAI